VGEIDSRVPEIVPRVPSIDSRVVKIDSRVPSAGSRVGEIDSRVPEIDSRMGEIHSRVAELKRVAPTFCREFFRGLDTKSEIKKAFFELQDWLQQPAMQRLKDRASQRAMLRKAADEQSQGFIRQ
jgi:hypothetical protein